MVGNLEPRGVRQRAVTSAAMALVAAAGWILLRDAAPAWRLGLFLPFWLGGLGFFQARAKT